MDVPKVKLRLFCIKLALVMSKYLLLETEHRVQTLPNSIPNSLPQILGCILHFNISHELDYQKMCYSEIFFA